MKDNLHYYSENQDNLQSNPTEFVFNFKDHTFKFHSDDGVFSKNYIDYGTFVMLKTFVPNDIDLPILDMGAGYGPIGIVVSKLYNKKTIMCEINSRAYDLILKNIEENKSDSIAYHSNLFDALDNEQKFSSIITNPPIRAGKDIVFKIYEGSYERLTEGGELWVVIQKKQGAPSSKEKLISLFGNCEIINKDKGYYILKSIKTN